MREVAQLQPSNSRVSIHKAQLIRDHVKPSSRVGSASQEQLIATMENGALTFRKQEPKLSSISVGQWIAANSIILQEMIRKKLQPASEDTGLLTDVLGYLDYNRKIGELLDADYSQSVIWEFDEDYRKLVAETGML